jgi:hypothetical protein
MASGYCSVLIAFHRGTKISPNTGMHFLAVQLTSLPNFPGKYSFSVRLAVTRVHREITCFIWQPVCVNVIAMRK